MAWVRLDDQMPEHPKFDALSDSAFRLHIHGLCYCARQLTDGVIKTQRAQRLMDTDDAEDLIWELVGAGLWEPIQGGFLIHDYLSYNPSRESIQRKRAATAKRQQTFRDKHVTETENEHVSNASRNAVTNTSPVPSRPVPLSLKRDVGGVGDDAAEEEVIIPISADVDPRVYEVLEALEQPRTKNNVKYVSLKIVKYPRADPVTKALEAHDHIRTHPRKYSFPLRVWGNWMKPAKWEQEEEPKTPTNIRPMLPTNAHPDVFHAFQIVSRQVSTEEYNTYFGDVTTSQPQGTTVWVTVADKKRRQRFENRFLPMLTLAFHEIHSPLRPQLAG